MPTEFLQKFGFSAGVLSPLLYSRGDIKKYDLGLANARNFLIDYLGGALSRPGTEFLDYVQDMGEPCRLWPFEFNSSIANTYLLVFTKNRIRFVQDGAYVLETAKAASASGTDITCTGHGFSVGDWFKIGTLTLEVTAAPDANTLKAQFANGDTFNASDYTFTELQRIYTVSSPYATADLATLKFDQDKDAIYLNHLSYSERKLLRIAATNWTLTETAFYVASSGPASITETPSDVGSSGVAYAVAKVDKFGIEYPLVATALRFANASKNITQEYASMKIAWPAVTDAASYKVYRGQWHKVQAEVNFGPEFGLLGSTRGTQFTDNNNIPDFGQPPLTAYNPFAHGAIDYIEITAAGAAYNQNSATVSIAGGGGSGFEGKPIVEAGAVIGVRILNPGKGYSSPVVTFSAGGATATATATEASGNNPGSSAAVQQRRVRAGTLNNPLGIFGSRVAEPDSYATTNLGLATDPYILTLDSQSASPIRHILASNDGFFLFTDKAVHQVRGAEDTVLTATSAKQQPQNEEGCADLWPIRIDKEIVYLHADRRSVHALRPSNLPTYFTLADVSIFSSHFFERSNSITDWTWAKAPYKVVWAVRDDGSLLSMTFVPEQEVNAWSYHTTDGFFENVADVRENFTDRPYFIVNRRGVRMLERLALGEEETLDESWSVDSGLATSFIYPAAALEINGTSGTLQVRASASVFSAGDVGKVLRVGRGKAEVTAYISGTVVTVEFIRPIQEPLPELTGARTFPEGTWSLMPKVSSISGLDHLEGREVEILADGRVQPSQTVLNGMITLETPASYVIAGLPFTAELKTLPTFVEGSTLGARQKRVVGLAVRVNRSSTIRFGDAEGDRLYELPSTFDNFLDGMYEITLNTSFDLDGSMLAKKVGPVGVQLLGFIMKMEFEGAPA